MTKKKVYDYIIDGSNVLHESKMWGDEKTEFEGEMVDAINVERIELTLAYFQTRGYNVLICVDYSTHKKYTDKKLPIKPSRNAFGRFFSKNKNLIHRIQSDADMVKLKQENPGSIIVTNDSFTKEINAENNTSGFTKDQWQNEAKVRQEFGFKDGSFTLARKKYKFTKGKELANKPLDNKDLETTKPDDPHYLDNIRSRLQSLDDRTQSQNSKINNINSIVQDLSAMIEDFTTSSTKSNSSELIPCKFKDEFGQSHLCLLGENLYIWQDGKWIEIALGGN
mgnify:FL=1|jgi:hypothetical protein